MTKFFKKPLVLFLIFIIAAGVVVYFYFIKKGEVLPSFIIAQKGEILQEVSVTGKTKPRESVDLAFEAGGKVEGVFVKVGDKVYRGEPLVKLNQGELNAQLLDAEANVASQKAKLDELNIGTRPEEIRVEEVKVVNAQTALLDAKKDLLDKLQDAYTKADDAVRSRAGQFFSNSQSSNPQLNLLYVSSDLAKELESGRFATEQLLVYWKTGLDAVDLSSDLHSFGKTTQINLDKVKSFLDKMALAIFSLTPYSGFTQTTIDSYKLDIATARTNLNTAVVNLSTSREKLSGADSVLSLAREQLDLKKAGSTKEEIESQNAVVQQAEAKAELVRVKLSKTVLYSPLNGVVTKQDAKVGEIVAQNSVLVSVISQNRLEIEAYIPEADIAKVKIGDTAKLTLDAYGSDEIFNARVIKIDPSETMIEGVATYKTAFQFEKEDERIKPGMTANLDISTNKKEGVITVPQRVITTKNGKKFVTVMEGAARAETEVKIGLKGIDGNVEILSGIKEGDKLIVPEK